MAQLFKGYIESKGKTPLKSVLKGEYTEFPPSVGDYVGVLKEGYVQVDFDDSKFAEIALKLVEAKKLRCDVLKTTRGVHLYFKDSKNVVKSQAVGTFTAMGLPCDIGLGSRNRVVPLKTTKEVETIRVNNGVETVSKSYQTTTREWLKTYDELDELPCFLRPLGNYDYHLLDCDSRNQTLFNYILKLQTHAFTKEEVRQTLKVINEFVLREPLSDKELDTITRDDAFSEELFFDDKGKFKHDIFGNYMLSNSNILMIDKIMNIYNSDNVYSNSPDEFERAMLNKIPNLKDAQRKEVYKYLNLKCVNKGEFASPKYIGLKNDILDIQTGEMFPYSPKWVMNNKIDFNYNPNAYNETMDKTLDKVCCGDKQIRALFEEMVGYTLYRKNTMQVCFILTGEGSNGKSTMLNCIKKLIGKTNYTSLDLRELEDTFKPSEMYGKLANIGDDISNKYLETSSVFKKVVTGESFMVQRKYERPFEMECYATQIFCANELPPVNDKSDGFSRRLVIMPFNAKFSKNDVDYDPFIEDKLLSDEAIEYLLKLAIEGLKRVINGKQFTKSDKAEREKQAYIQSNNNVLEYFLNDVVLENCSVNDAYLAYQVWCTQSGCMSVKKANFSKEVKKEYGLESVVKKIDGKSVRVYVNIEK